MTAVFSLPPLVDASYPANIVHGTLLKPATYQIFAPVSTVRDRIGKMLVAVEFHGHARVEAVVAKEIDFKLSEPEPQQIGGQQHGDETVGECAQRARREHAADHHYFEP